MPGPLPVSIVIPTFERIDVLRAVLPSYFAQECAEVVIVDDAGDVPVPSMDDADGSTSVIQLRNERRSQQPFSRMRGVEASSQPYVMFGEDDVLLAPGHVANLLTHLEDGAADIVAAALITTDRLDTSLSHELVSALPTCDLRDLVVRASAPVPEVTSLPLLHSIALMRRETATSIGFDEGFKGNAFREETDFYLRAWELGLRAVFVPGPPAFHYKGELNLGGGHHAIGVLGSLARYEYWVVRNNIRLLKKHKDFLELRGRPTRPVWDTTRMLARRTRGYPGRVREKLVKSRQRRVRRPTP